MVTYSNHLQTGWGRVSVSADVHKKQSRCVSAGWDVEKVKDHVVESFRLRNAIVHAVDGQLQQQAEQCQAYVDLMEDSMPYECALVNDFQWVKANLFSLKS